MLCVIAKLDETATGKLASIQKAALPDAAPSGPLHGHITIAAYIGDKEAEFLQFCKGQIDGIPSFLVEYKKIEVLEDTAIIAASPEKSGALEDIHRRIAREYGGSLNQWSQADWWYPHTTLLYDPALDLHRICRKMSAALVPFSARVCRIEFSRVLESGYDIIDRVELPD